MKVILIGPVYPYRGGIAHYNASLAQALANAGHDVRLISFCRQYPTRLYPGKSDKDPSGDPLGFPAEYLLDPLYPWTWLHAARVIQTATPGLVLFHWWTTFWAPAYTSLAWLIRKKVKVAFLIHNVLPHEAKVWDRWMACLTLRQGQAFIVQAPHERERLATLIPTSSQVFESPHPAYLPFGKQKLAKADARQQLGLPQEQPVLLFFGIVRPYKGLKYLVEAFSHVQHPSHLVIAGEFWEDVSAYQQQIGELGLTKRITIYNRYIPNEEAHRLYSAADGLVAPYVGGTQSGAAGLALGYGLPMILTDRVAAGLPSAPSTGQHSPNATLNDGYASIVPPADPVALTQAIDDLLSRLPTLPPARLPAAVGWSRLVKVIDTIGQAK